MQSQSARVKEGFRRGDGVDKVARKKSHCDTSVIVGSWNRC